MSHAKGAEDAEGEGSGEREEKFFTTNYTKDTKGGGRGLEKLRAALAKGGERGKRESEEWPMEHMEYTEKSKRGIGRVAGTRGGKRRTITRTMNENDGRRVAHGTHGKIGRGESE